MYFCGPAAAATVFHLMPAGNAAPPRSEEHTSELQSPDHLVCRLLLEKKKVIYCSTTDPYQVFRHPDQEQRKHLTDTARYLIRRSLELIRDHSTLNVRILTRSPLAKRDFDLFQSFGKRLLFGMRLPSLRDDLARVYEPRAPSPFFFLMTRHPPKSTLFPKLAPFG